jgi:hypothetical protein
MSILNKPRHSSICWRCQQCFEPRQPYSIIHLTDDPPLSTVLKQIRAEHARRFPNCPINSMAGEQTDISLHVRGIQ